MYKITFADGEFFLGGPPQDSKWANMPNKPIRRIEYYIDRVSFCLEGYENYNHIIERVALLEQSKEHITKIFIMGRQGNYVFEAIYDLTFAKFFTRTTKYGEEYKNKPTLGWKVGILHQTPNYTRLR
jgi:hypothetical protein